MSDIRTRIADALAEHLFWPSSDCPCGECELSGPGGPAERRRRHEMHLADVLLSLRRIAIIELPEPTPQGVLVARDTDVRELAAALLAAANAAEES